MRMKIQIMAILLLVLLAATVHAVVSPKG